MFCQIFDSHVLFAVVISVSIFPSSIVTPLLKLLSSCVISAQFSDFAFLETVIIYMLSKQLLIARNVAALVEISGSMKFY